MPTRERGFALVLAILAVLLLTLLGLSVATSSSTELQIATNYRWQEQARQNAESGIEVARAILRTASWTLILPVPRTTPWLVTSAPPSPAPAPYPRATRNYEMGACDRWGHGMGYGVVLDDGAATAPYEDISTVYGQTLNGSFTVWIRRPLRYVAADTAVDETDSNVMMVTSQGEAPFVRGQLGSSYTQVGRALQVMEARLRRRLAGSTWYVQVEKLYVGSVVCN
jgi:hypothetical protein